VRATDHRRRAGAHAAHRIGGGGVVRHRGGRAAARPRLPGGLRRPRSTPTSS
jgi:hypothetical protein